MFPQYLRVRLRFTWLGSHFIPRLPCFSKVGVVSSHEGHMKLTSVVSCHAGQTKMDDVISCCRCHINLHANLVLSHACHVKFSVPAAVPLLPVETRVLSFVL